MTRQLRDPVPGESLGYGQGSLSWDRSRPGIMVLKYAGPDGKRYTERGRSWAEVEGKRRDRLARLTEDPYMAALRQRAHERLDAMDAWNLEDFLGIGEMPTRAKRDFLGLEGEA